MEVCGGCLVEAEHLLLCLAPAKLAILGAQCLANTVDPEGVEGVAPVVEVPRPLHQPQRSLQQGTVIACGERGREGGPSHAVADASEVARWSVHLHGGVEQATALSYHGVVLALVVVDPQLDFPSDRGVEWVQAL
jgi:hypothetical protein